jgi:hypothetical protein
LTRASASFSGGDTNNDGIFDVNETWSWIVTPVRIDDTIVFTSTGYGIDPMGNNVTPPAYPEEQYQVTVNVVPLVPAISGFGIAFLVGVLAGLIVLLNLRQLQRRS